MFCLVNNLHTSNILCTLFIESFTIYLSKHDYMIRAGVISVATIVGFPDQSISNLNIIAIMSKWVDPYFIIFHFSAF